MSTATSTKYHEHHHHRTHHHRPLSLSVGGGELRLTRGNSNLESPPDSTSASGGSSADAKTFFDNNEKQPAKTVTPSETSTSSPSTDSNPVGDVYCICRRSAAEDEAAGDAIEDDIMIECDHCKDWLHGRCVNLTQRLMADIEIYICPRCVTETRPIIYKKRKNFHRHDYSDSNAAKKPVQAGTPMFVEQLLQRKFLDAFEHNIIVDLKDGHELNVQFLNKRGFDKPILIRNKQGLGFTVPNEDEIDLSKIEDIVGGDYQLDVIDVQRQETYRMNINELNTYFRSEPRIDKVYNLISFEISKTRLTENVDSPHIVKEISWVSNGVWPPENEESQMNDSGSGNGNGNDNSPSKAAAAAEGHKKKGNISKPEVQKYCLISAARSYTDFHIDFGGSSVWYHIVKGSKIFYLIEPNDENLKAYEHWNTLKNHSEIFLGDKVKQCFKFEIDAGNTILLPTGWIHAVYTPSDSLVFGGNFLQSFNIPLQIKYY